MCCAAVVFFWVERRTQPQPEASKHVDRRAEMSESIREAPTFYPTADEFADPYAYIEK